MSNQPGNAFFQGVDNYVPQGQYTEGGIGGAFAQFLGRPVLGTAGTGVATAVAKTGTLGTETAVNITLAEPFGRTLRAIDSADPGAALGVFDVYGWDYLGQAMTERFTGVNGSTPIQVGLKAFKRVKKIRLITAATNAVTTNFGFGLRLGIPYKGAVTWIKEDGVFVAVSIGTNWILPVLTDPQTATTGDPKGTIAPAAAFDGVKEFECGLTVDNDVNPAGNGGMHGIKHFVGANP